MLKPITPTSFLSYQNYDNATESTIQVERSERETLYMVAERNIWEVTGLIVVVLVQNPQTDRNNEDVPNRPAPTFGTSSFYQSKLKRSSGYAPGEFDEDGYSRTLQKVSLSLEEMRILRGHLNSLDM